MNSQIFPSERKYIREKFQMLTYRKKSIICFTYKVSVMGSFQNCGLSFELWYPTSLIRQAKTCPAVVPAARTENVGLSSGTSMHFKVCCEKGEQFSILKDGDHFQSLVFAVEFPDNNSIPCILRGRFSGYNLDFFSSQ